MKPPVGEGRDLRLGADVRRVSGQTQELYTYVNALPTRRRVAGGTALTYGLFTDASLTAGPATLTLGGRVDRWRLTDGALREAVIATGAPLTNAIFPERRGTEWTGRAGIAVTPVAP